MQRQGAVVDEVQLGLEVFAVEAQVPVEEVQLLGRLVEGLGGGAGLLAARGETQQAVADATPFSANQSLRSTGSGPGKFHVASWWDPCPSRYGWREK